MAIFSGKVISAQFIDSPNNMLIEVLYQEEDKVVPYVLEVDFTQQDFIDLLQEITLEEIQKNTEQLKKAEFDVFEKMINDEVNRRWEGEQEKIKAAYDRAENYAKEIIEREAKKFETSWAEIDANWETLKKEYMKLESAWKEIEQESGRIEGAWKEIEGESGRIEGAWKEIEGESARIEGAWKEIEKGFKQVDEYAEGEKSKKMEEVESEFQKLRQELATKFNTGTVSSKLDGKDIFHLLMANEEDNDFVFNLKIAVLEDPAIAKSKDKAMKLAIRKSKSVTELLSIYYAQKRN